MSNSVNYNISGKSFPIQLLIILGLLNLSGAVIKIGKCVYPTVVENFQAEEFFNGTWYEILSYGNEIFQGFGSCSGLVSRVTEDNQIVLKTYSYQPILENYVTIDGKSRTQYVIDGKGSLPITFEWSGGLISKEYQAHIIDTVYENFAVIYLCKQKFLVRSEMAYLLSRDQSESMIDDNLYSSRIVNAFYQIGLLPSNLRRSVNTNCGDDQPMV